MIDHNHVGVFLVLAAVLSLGARSLLLEKFKKVTKKEGEESEIKIIKKVTKKEDKESEIKMIKKVTKKEDKESEIIK